MALVIGIDEAGYGPLLGPLVVTGVAFEMPDAQVGESLWHLLDRTVTARLSKRDPRLPVLDSKKLYKRKDGIGPLERSVLAFAHLAEMPSSSFRVFLAGLSSQVASEMGGYDWYKRFECALPTAGPAGSIALHAAAIMGNLESAGIRLSGIACEPLLEARFNQLVAATRNKSAVATSLAYRIADRLIAQSTSENVLLRVDRQGGRLRYADSLMKAFSVNHIDIVCENEQTCRYRFHHRRRRIRAEFLTGGETHALPIALAGMFSKYVRELFMLAFNEYWRSRVHDLKPTAGYYQDARRFISDIKPVLDQSANLTQRLVRTR